jgi:hypothetical protein
MTVQQHDLERLAASPLPDGSLFKKAKVVPAEWKRLQPGQKIIVRLKGSSDLLGIEVVTNQLAHPAAPCLVGRQLKGEETATFKRRDIRDIQLFEVRR